MRLGPAIDLVDNVVNASTFRIAAGGSKTYPHTTGLHAKFTPADRAVPSFCGAAFGEHAGTLDVHVHVQIYL